jgi:hypothetical protein
MNDMMHDIQAHTHTHTHTKRNIEVESEVNGVERESTRAKQHPAAPE